MQSFTVYIGEMSLFYLFTRYKFNWSEIEFSLFSTYSMGIHLIGELYETITQISILFIQLFLFVPFM